MPRSALVAALVTALVGTAAPAIAAVPAEGVPFVPRTGAYAEVLPGGFFTLGGSNPNHVSNLQPYFGFAVGYDVLKELSVYGTFAAGWSASNCFAEVNALGNCTASDNFAFGFFEAGARYRYELIPRFSVSGLAQLGYAIMAPGPLVDPANPTQAASLNSGFSVGVGVGIDYATRLDHFWVGVDVILHDVLSVPVFSVAIAPRMRYVF